MHLAREDEDRSMAEQLSKVRFSQLPFVPHSFEADSLPLEVTFLKWSVEELVPLVGRDQEPSYLLPAEPGLWDCGDFAAGTSRYSRLLISLSGLTPTSGAASINESIASLGFYFSLAFLA